MRLLVICSVLYGFPSPAALDSTLARMDRGAATFKGVTAHIRRVSHNAVLNEDNIDSGTIMLKRPKRGDMRMLIQLTEPDQKAVAFQGRKLEMYFPKIATVQEYDVGKNRALLDQFLLLGFGISGRELAAAYNIRELGTTNAGSQKAARLELIPKSKEVLQRLRKVELWIGDSGYPVQQKFFMPSGEYMAVTYTDLKTANISDSALKLKLPPNVKREYPQKQ